MKTKKKVFAKNLSVFFSRNQVKTKKKVFPAIWDYILPEFVGFIRAGWPLIVSSSSAQVSIGGRLNIDGGTRPPYNLSTVYNVIFPKYGHDVITMTSLTQN